METKHYTTVDKSLWPRGEWDLEPDKVQWPDPATGLPCLVIRGPSGALCGYVGVGDTHPWHGKSYSQGAGPHLESCTEEYCFDHCIGSRVTVHGGLTFSEGCAHSADESRHICHVPGPGEPDNVWWFGFDCAHAGDLCPKYDLEYRNYGYESYKTLAYVRQEVTELAAQLAAQ